ncbi:hypothetical protein [Thiocapsa sp.]|uniref:hypothetical protein n=1 Tax=Thiocapsa sp. TaxID=2024551 RepID=UPI002BD92AA3|nr:hypothetical protein [Thiocapsa sp.]HSO84285.1 hypothetical protein [Thiocapsa sp.]
MQKRAEIHAVPIDPERETGRQAPRPRQYRLTSARQIRKELSRLYGELRTGQTDAETARTGAFLMRTILESIRVDQIETELDALEEAAR